MQTTAVLNIGYPGFAYLPWYDMHHPGRNGKTGRTCVCAVVVRNLLKFSTGWDCRCRRLVRRLPYTIVPVLRRQLALRTHVTTSRYVYLSMDYSQDLHNKHPVLLMTTFPAMNAFVGVRRVLAIKSTQSERVTRIMPSLRMKYCTPALRNYSSSSRTIAASLA